MKKFQEIKPIQYRGTFLSAELPSCIVSIKDMSELHKELLDTSDKILTSELSNLSRPLDMETEEFDNFISNARVAGKLRTTIVGADGEQIVTQVSDPFSESALPKKLSRIEFDSTGNLKEMNSGLQNRFSILIDFSEPPSLDTYNPLSESTPNLSRFEVIGTDKIWTSGVFQSIQKFFESRRKNRDWLHSNKTFNVLQWVLFVPAALWIIYRIDGLFFETVTIHPVLLGGIYVYSFLLVLLIFRSILWGFRWLHPLVELKGSKSQRARKVFSTIVTIFLLPLLIDFVIEMFR